MVVVSIIGLVSAVVIITFTGNRRDTELETRKPSVSTRCSTTCANRRNCRPATTAFASTTQSYSFVVFDVIANEWRPVEEDDALREREFPEGIEPHVVVEGRTIVLDANKKDTRGLQAAGDDLRERRPVIVRGRAASAQVRGTARASTRTNKPTSACCCPVRPSRPRTAGTHTRRTLMSRIQRRHERGFTLLEVLIALAIVAHVGGRVAGHGHLLGQQLVLSQGQDAGRMGRAQSAHRNSHRPAVCLPRASAPAMPRWAACTGNGKKK